MAFALNGLGVPDLVREILDSAVQLVFPMIDRQGILNTIDGEFGVSDSVAKATD